MHENEFIIKSNESLAEKKKRNLAIIIQIHMHGNNIHEHGKQQNE